MSFFTPKTDFLVNFNDKGKYLLVWRLSLILSFLFLVSTILNYFVDIQSAILYAISFVICLTCFLYLITVRKIKPIFWAFTISASLVVTFSLNTMMHTLHYPDFIWAICTIVFAYIGLGKKYGIFFLIFHIISLIHFFVFGINLHLSQLKTIPFGQQLSVLFEMLTAFFALTYLINQYLNFQTHTEKVLQQVNDELNHKNTQNETLLKEIHHRIKNNLQLVISLLRMHRNEIDNEIAKENFTEAINRIMSISLIHQKLYQNEDLSDFDMNSYISGLINEIKLLNQVSFPIASEINIKMEHIGLKTLVPLGLMINELMTNSVKHAFKQNETNKIEISILKENNDYFSFSYKDSGTWNNEKDQNGFGLDLIEMLVNQMEGSHARKNSFFQFRLKNLDLD
jgi:two-component system, sensor histidine kinase PdtaS